MLSKRIIPCLDVKNGRTVKGINFNNLVDAGSPAELAYKYFKDGADELVLLDITATLEDRKTFKDTVLEVAKAISIPFTVGGGISNEKQVEELLRAGADKVSINSAALRNPSLITALANAFGSQCITIAIDTKHIENQWEVVSHSGTMGTIWNPFAWAKEAENLGAGEILLTSYSSDGTQQGFAVELTKEISKSVSIPVIASGGAGCMEHFLDIFSNGYADAALAAGVFHFGKLTIQEVKQYLNSNNIPVRI